MSKPVIVLVHYKGGGNKVFPKCKVTFNLTIDDQPPIPIEGHETTHFLLATFILSVPDPDIPDDKNLSVSVKNNLCSQSGKTYYISATLRDSDTNNLLYTTTAKASVNKANWARSTHKITVFEAQPNSEAQSNSEAQPNSKAQSNSEAQPNSKADIN